jgi:hypothetical protein
MRIARCAGLYVTAIGTHAEVMRRFILALMTTLVAATSISGCFVETHHHGYYHHHHDRDWR